MTTDFIERGFGLDGAASPRRAGRLGSFFAVLLARARNAHAERRYLKQQRRLLHGLSERTLRDIGLSEAEIRDLRASEPFPRLSPENVGQLLPR
jgi:uncharacterized protein YjiS (DUF1127 family)